MSNLKTLRNRVKSIKSTQKITKAMQMVAASKFQKVKNQLGDSTYYLQVLSEIMSDIGSSDVLGDLSPEEQRLFATQSDKPNLLVIITSERGLCGSFNSAIIKKLKIDIGKFEQSGQSVKIIVVGRKGYEGLKTKYANYIDSYFNVSKENDSNIFSLLKQRIINMVEKMEVKSCYIYFNQFKNAMVQIPTEQKLLPIDLNDYKASSVVKNFATTNQENIPSSSGPNNNNVQQNLFEYEGAGLVRRAIDLYLDGQINFALLQSRASEEGARMTAMDNATKNAGEIINKVTLKLNRSRQAIITNELVEIISGAGAL